MSKNNELLNCQFKSLLDCLSIHEKHHLLNIVRNEIGVDISEGVGKFNLDEYFFNTKSRKEQEEDIKVELRRVRKSIRTLKQEVKILKEEGPYY